MRSFCVPVVLLLGLLAPAQNEIPPSVQTKFDAAIVSFQQGNLQQARRLVEECLSSYPSSYEFHTLKGAIAAQLKEWKAAENSFQQVLRLKPDHTSALFNLALVYKNVGQYEKGIAAIDQFLKEQEAGAEAEAELHELVASLHELEGDPVEATRHLYLAVSLDANKERYYYSLGSQLLTHGNYSEAERMFREGAARFSNSARLHLGLGSAAALKDPLGVDYELAGRSFLRAAVLNPEDELPYRFLSFLPTFAYATAEVGEDMVRILESLAAEHPGNAMAQYLFAVVLFQRKRAQQGSVDMPRVEKLLTRALELKPQLDQAYFWLGRLYREMRKYNQSVSTLQQAISLKPEIPIYHYQLGQVYMLMGRREDGKRELTLFETLSEKEEEQVSRRRRLLSVLHIRW